jgi:tyrosyl-tRNA synthetase
MSVSDELMDRYHLLLLGEPRDPALHPMEAKKRLAARLTARYHDAAEAAAARADWETRFSKRDLAAAELPELPAAKLAADLTVLALVALCFRSAFGVE